MFLHRIDAKAQKAIKIGEFGMARDQHDLDGSAVEHDRRAMSIVTSRLQGIYPTHRSS
jgi:hypothetical protein